VDRQFGRLTFGVAAVALIATTAAWLSGPHLEPWFASYFGSAPPALCVAALGVVALVIAPTLKQRGFWGAPRVQAVPVIVLLVLGFAALIVAVDRLAGLPADINAPLPWALLYYPAMGFAAQIALHVLPLAAMLRAIPDFAQRRPWAVMTISAAPESALQALGSEASAGAIVALHLLGFGVAEVYLLRRFGFISMYAFRIGYYLLWHIVWGGLR